MIDETLIQKLRDSKGWPTLGNAAADRIAELKAKKDSILKIIYHHSGSRNGALGVRLLVERAEAAEKERDALQAKLEIYEGNSGFPFSSTGMVDEMAKSIERKDKRIAALQANLDELLVVSKRAVRLSLDHPDFKLYAMDLMRQAISSAEQALKGTNNDT